jgi:membrane protein required for colicin V production
MYYLALMIAGLIFIWRIMAGFKKGMVQEIVSLAATAAAAFCVILILGAVGSYREKEIGQMLQFVTVLIVVCLVYRLANILFTSLQLISKLPIIKGLDKLLGAVVGAAEAGLIVGILTRYIKIWGLSQLIHG